MAAQPGDNPLNFQKTTLDNGLRVVTCEMPHTRSVSISIFVGVGSRYESTERAGVSHFVEHMVFKGTTRRPAPGEISAIIEATGGLLNAGTEQEMTVFWCKVAEPHFQDSLELLIDMLRDSLLDPEGIEIERMVVLDELGLITDNPGSKVDALTDQMLWPDHPLGRDIGGTKESVAGITRDMLLEHIERYYTPSNTVVSVSGNIPHLRVVRKVEALCEGWPSSTAPDWTPFTHTQSASQSQVEYRKTEQAHLSIAVPGLPVDHPDQYALDLLSVVLGEGMSSRLFVELRERRGLAYDVHSGVAHFLDCGAFVISAGVDPKRVYDAVQTILEQASAMKEDLPEEELEKAKRLVTGRLLLRMEDTRVISGWMGNQELLMGRIIGLDEVVHKVNAVTSGDIRRVANDLLLTQKLNLALVGPSRGHRRLEKLLRL